MVVRIWTRGLVGLAAGILFVVAGCSESNAQSVVKGDMKSVCAEGAKDGTFRYWASNEQDNIDRIKAAFAKEHPGIEIQYLSLHPADIAQRLLVTNMANKDVVDVDLISGNMGSFFDLLEKGIIDKQIDWISLGVPAEALDGTKTMSRVYRVAQGLAYNSDVTKPEDLPDTWEGLINPKWAGQVSVHLKGLPLYLLALVKGEEQTLNFVNQLKKVDKPVLAESGTASMQSVVSKEVLISTTGRSDSLDQMRQSGAPIAMKYLDLVPFDEQYNAVLAKSPHKAPAACFAAWMGSPSGLKVLKEVEGTSNIDRPEGVPATAKLISIKTVEDAKLAGKVSKEVAKVWMRAD